MKNGKIAAEAVLLSTDTEMTARIVAANDTFMIEQAEWESLRSDSHYGPNGGEPTELIGAKAYFGVASSLARAFPGKDAGPQRILFAECIKAVIQSECYLYRQRGFPDKQEYQNDWDATHPNSCRYYSHLDIVARRWFDHIGEEPREGTLFHRHKNIALWRSGLGGLRATASFLDSFHELGIQAECSVNGQVLAFDACFLRAPDSICFGTAALSTIFIGQNIREITRKDLSRQLGGREGCAHLLDLGQGLLIDLQKSINSFDDVCQ